MTTTFTGYDIAGVFDDNPSAAYPWRLEAFRLREGGKTGDLIAISDPARTLPEALRQLSDALERNAVGVICTAGTSHLPNSGHSSPECPLQHGGNTSVASARSSGLPTANSGIETDACAQCRVLDGADPDPRHSPNSGKPTRWWHCGTCNAHLERYRGGGDMACDCGAEYNAFGQRLDDNWRSNASLYDDEIGDLEGYELGALSNENCS